MDSTRASERRKFTSQRASLMFDAHLTKLGHKPLDWAGNVHDSGAEADVSSPAVPLSSYAGSDADAERARLRGRS